MDVLALPPPLGRLMQTACASLGRHPLLMDGDSPANFRRGSLQAGNEIRAAARHLLSFGCSASSGLSPPSLLLLLFLLFTHFLVLLFLLLLSSPVSCHPPPLQYSPITSFSVSSKLFSTCWDSFHSALCLQLFSSILL